MELDHIMSDSKEETTTTVSWLRLLSNRHALAICMLKFLTDWVWWFLLFWTPDLLNKMFGVSIKDIVVPLIVIFAMASVGGVGGGWYSSAMIRKGRSIDFARKTAMIVCAFLMLSILFIPASSSLWVAVSLLSLSTAAHQGWSSNVFTIASDIFPKNMVGSVVSFAGFIAAFAGSLSAALIGLILQLTQCYTIVFVTAGSMYFLSWFILRLMVPRIDTIGIDSIMHVRKGIVAK